MLETAWILNSKPGGRESNGQNILAVGNPFWVSHAADYFPWQDLPRREWELLMELSFMGFVCLMWWWNVLGVLFKERWKTVSVGGEEKHTNRQCNLVYYFRIELKSYIYEVYAFHISLMIDQFCWCYNIKKHAAYTGKENPTVLYCRILVSFLLWLSYSQCWHHCCRQTLPL